MEIVKKKRPPYVYFAIFVILLAATAVSIGLFKTEVVEDIREPSAPVERENLSR